MIGDRNFLDEPTKSDIRVFENIGKVANDQEEDYATGYLIDYIYFKEKLIDCNRFTQAMKTWRWYETIRQINFHFTKNLDIARNKNMFFIIEGVTVTLFLFCFWFNIIWNDSITG